MTLPRSPYSPRYLFVFLVADRNLRYLGTYLYPSTCLPYFHDDVPTLDIKILVVTVKTV